MAIKNFDVVVIGAGPGGYVGAIRAAQLGKKVAIIEESHLGGICLNWGCIPTKALLKTSEVLMTIQHAQSYGIKVSKPEVDFASVIERSRKVANQLSNGIAHLMKKNKVEVIMGRGRFSGKDGNNHLIEISKDGKVTETVSAPHVILATGARARSFPGMEPDGKNIWTYKEAMVPKELPKSLLIVGSGAIGIEFASFYSALGVEVTVVEVMDRILPVEDIEISSMARKAFEARGIKIHTSTTVKSLSSDTKSVTATLEMNDKKTENLKVERVILAVGIVGNVEDIGLEKTKVKIEKTHVITDQWCQTDEPGIYAIGDIADAPWLAHKASHEGILAAEHIAGLSGLHKINKSNIPGCTYSYPQIASVGMTEKACKDAGYTIKVGKFPYLGNGKAIAMGEPEGLIKTIFDAKTGELLGAHMIGAEVTEMIQGYGLGKSMEATELDFINAIYPHPTLSEMMHESVLDAFGRVIHM